MATNVGQLLEQAAAERARSNWIAALKLYQAAAVAAPGQPAIHHNLALCLYAQGRHSEGIEHAYSATRLAPRLTQAWVLRAKIERALDAMDPAEHSLRTALDVQKNDPQALLELASLTMNELGDALETQRLVAPLLDHPVYDEDARLATLMAKLYDREESAEEFTAQIVAFARKYLCMPGFRFTAARKPVASGKKRKARVGLLSPLFSVSPVYFFTIGSLSLLAEEVDFVVFNRGTKNDWATEAFRKIAREWCDVAHMPAPALANALYAESLDVIIDMGGWIDPVGLKALSTKPATRMYKWVGGQSCTTGLPVFDGYWSDHVQSPEELSHLYTEPLVLLSSGYVTYTPPPYMPAKAPAHAKSSSVGLIANPAKISRSCVGQLRRTIETSKAPVDVRFVDRRHRHASVRSRITRGLMQSSIQQSGKANIEFRAPKSHAEYLREVSELAEIHDTYPYNGGLTTTEALFVGVACTTNSGSLFCERHTLSHQAYFSSSRTGPANCQRVDHNALALELHGHLDVRAITGSSQQARRHRSNVTHGRTE